MRGCLLFNKKFLVEYQLYKKGTGTPVTVFSGRIVIPLSHDQTRRFMTSIISNLHKELLNDSLKDDENLSARKFLILRSCEILHRQDAGSVASARCTFVYTNGSCRHSRGSFRLARLGTRHFGNP